MNTILDVAIGILLLYLLLALIVTTIQELVASLLHLRAKQLYAALAGMLTGTVGTDTQLLLHAFYEHPLVRNLTNRAPNQLFSALGALGRGLPSYIPSRTFAIVLVDVLRGTKTAADTLGAAELLGSARQALAKIDDPDLKRVLTLLLGDAEQISKDLNERSQLVSERLETWFNDRMARAAGTYKRYAQIWSLALALVVTVAFNADTLHVASRLWLDGDLRDAVVAQARSVVPSDAQVIDASAPVLPAEARDLLAGGLPIGWGAGGSPLRPLTPLGWLLTALLVSLGATFWFDVLSRALKLRGTGPRVSAATGRVATEVLS